MNNRTSVWKRIACFFRPERESYDSRRARPGEPGAPLTTQKYEATDSRRHGGSGALGA